MQCRHNWDVAKTNPDVYGVFFLFDLAMQVLSQQYMPYYFPSLINIALYTVKINNWAHDEDTVL